MSTSTTSTDVERKFASSPSSPIAGDDTAKTNRQWIRAFVDSFRRAPYAAVETPTDADDGGFNHAAAARRTANSGLAHRLKSRHMQMIAIGGSIGTGLFVTSGSTLSIGGPASLLISYGIISILMFCTVQALGEMAVLYPVAGSFSAYSTRFLDPAWGFAMGWNYAIQWLVILPLEIVAASITLSFWPGAGEVHKAIWVTVFFIIIVCINLFSVRGYGEAEFIFAIVKIIAVISFIILGIILNCGGGPDGDYIGGRYWRTDNVPLNYPGYLLAPGKGVIESGAFHSGFKGLCSVFVTAAFSFTGIELVGIAAAEADNPCKSVPTAVKQVFWRICLFYTVSLTVVSLLVPHGDTRLLGKSTDANASPFVIAIKNAGIAIVPSIMNVVILVAVLSVGNTSIYGSSRTLAALAGQGQAPHILAYIDRQGRPIVAVIFSSAIGLICYVGAGRPETANIALNWLSSLSGLSSIFTWGSICLAHIRYRAAWKYRGRSVEDLTFRSQVGIAGSWIGFLLNCLVLIAQFWTAIWPIGYSDKSSSEIAQGFFRTCLAAPVVVICYVSYKIYYKTPFMSLNDMDLDTGCQAHDTAEINRQMRLELAQRPRWKRVYKTIC
ncbi:general amino-acid permease/GAP1 [Blumeria hordei DH14]|uniref:General amino-acid permease/GAP1 n=1 Tax=Blumeria graminis f. sp. hordei (strain DH14) TaxID=546991 RepID=N1JN42_BLUG1|nr:general amino-acid permease/GAP1 [Blumeria hordei DH14]